MIKIKLHLSERINVLFHLNSIAFNSHANCSEELNIRSKSYLKEEGSMQEEELHESNYSNRSHIDSMGKTKIVGSKIAFINHDSYI
jgi:hypothetical protein